MADLEDRMPNLSGMENTTPHGAHCAMGWWYACADCYEKTLADHPTDCEVDECLLCGMRDCPYCNSTHYWHDGCGSCTETEGHE